jgi:hypothetical protein
MSLLLLVTGFLLLPTLAAHQMSHKIVALLLGCNTPNLLLLRMS